MVKKTKTKQSAKHIRYAEQPERLGALSPLAGITLGETALVPLNCTYRDDAHGIFLYQGDCLEVLDAIYAKYGDEGRFDMIFADPPYFLSNGGITCHAGKMVSVHKGDWDQHVFNYDLRRQTNGGKQMKTVWTMTSPSGDEKKFGKHPTQKPVALVERCVLAATNEGDLVLDPFGGGGTTAIACLRQHRRSVAIELDSNHCELAAKRLKHKASERSDLFSSITDAKGGR